jgi:hypothetical protein
MEDEDNFGSGYNYWWQFPLGSKSATISHRAILVDHAVENLWIDCTTVRAPIDWVKELASVTGLWLWSPNNGHMESLSGFKQLRTMVVKNARFHTLDIRSFEGIAEFALDGAPRLEGGLIRGLEDLPRLNRVYLCHLPKLNSLDNICGAELLSTLEINTSIGTAKYEYVESLAPLVRVRDLMDLRLDVVARDHSLAPLRSLSALRFCRLPSTYPLEEYAHLVSANSRLNGIPESGSIMTNIQCQCCRTGSLVLPLGMRRQLLCPRCDRDKYQAHYLRFQTLRSGWGPSEQG